MKLFKLFLVLLLVTSCTKVYLPETGPSSVVVTPTVRRDTIEFRVLSNASLVAIKFSNSLDGLSQIVTTPPYQSAFESTRDNIFVSLEATPITYPSTVLSPFLSVQIVVNGLVFREASSSNFSFNPISVGGTYRR